MALSWLAIDLEKRRLSFRTLDGHELELPMPLGMFPEANLQCVELDVVAGKLAVRMAGEPAAVVELRQLT